MKHYRVMLRDKLSFDGHRGTKTVDVLAAEFLKPYEVVEVMQGIWETWNVVGIEATA